MPETKVTVPDKVKAGGELIVSADSEICFVNIYESPRERFDEKDVDQENGFWRGDIYETTHPENFSADLKTVKLKIRRGPDNKPAVYGRYLVKTKLKGIDVPFEKFIEVYI